MVRNWWRRLIPPKSLQRGRSAAKPKRSRRPHIEQLEDRVSPVVGAFAVPGAVPRGGPYDGVVMQTRTLGGQQRMSTGSLLFTGRHILTAAHVVDSQAPFGTADVPVTATFQLNRGAENVDIPITVPVAHIAVPTAPLPVASRWNGNIGNGNDIAILRLTDQVQPAINRHLVPPLRAQRYQIYRDGNELGADRNFTVVGYGDTGTGATGSNQAGGTKRSAQNRWEADAHVLRNEIQRVAVVAPPPGGNFTLSIATAVTGDIPQAAAAGAVQTALENARTPAALTPLMGNVLVRGPNGGPWFVEFVGTAADTNIVPLVPNTVNVQVHEMVRGATIRPVAGTALAYDFDDNTNASTDVFGRLYGINDTGLGAAEGDTAPGDSGGPAFVGGNRIAGVVSFSLGFPVSPDGRADAAGVFTNDSFGELDVMTRAGAFATPFIDPTVAGRYHLVLDMNQQVLGRDRMPDPAVPGGTIPRVENLRIVARRAGSDLVLEVFNDSSPGVFAGEYYRAPLADLLSLTIRGMDDNETITIDGNLWNAGGISDITVDGRGGQNRLVVEDQNTTTNSLRYELTDQTLRRQRLDGTDRRTLTYMGFNNGLVVNGSQAYNQFDVASTHAAATTLNTGIGPNDTTVARNTGPLTINGQGGVDSVRLGNSTNGAQDIRGNVSVSNTGGLTSLSIDDAANPNAANNVVLTRSGLSGLAPATIDWVENDLNNLGLNGGRGGNTITARSTPLRAITRLFTGTGADRLTVWTANGPQLEIHGQNGSDTVTLSDAGSVQAIRGDVYITNASGSTAVTVDNSADPMPRNATLAPFGLFGLAPADIRWEQLHLNSLVITGSTVNAGAVGNTFRVTGSPRINYLPATVVLNTGSGSVGDTVTVLRTDKSPLTINGQNGPDAVTLSNAGSAQEIRSVVTVTNANGRTALTIDDSANPAARPNVVLTATRLTGLMPEVFEAQPVHIEWVERDLSSLVIKGGRGGNTFHVNNTPRNDFPVRTTLQTGLGNDTVNVQAANGPLTVEGQDGDDRVRFRNFTGMATIDGGPGSNDTIEVAQGTLSTSQVPFTRVEILEVTGGSTLVVNTDVSTGLVLVREGTLELRGGTPTVSDRVEIQPLGILTGAGTISGNVLNAGQVRVAGDGTVGRITVTGTYAQGITGRLNLDLEGTTPGTESDNLEVGNRVQLAGTLNLNALPHFGGRPFELITNRGAEAVGGTFAGLAEGAAVQVGGLQYRITYQGGDGNEVVLDLPPQQASTTTTVFTSVNPSVFGQLVTFTAAVNVVPPGMGVPTGTVTFLDGTTPLGTVPLSAGIATLSTDVLAAGSHTITAVYSGNVDFAGSSGSLEQIVYRADTEISLASLVNPSVYGEATTFNYVLGVVSPGAGTPTGIVTLYDTFNGVTTVLSSAPLVGPAPPFPPLAAGTHLIWVVYSGDANFNGSTSAPVTQIVYRADTAVTITSTANPAVYGEPLTFVLSLFVVAPGAGAPTGTITIYDTFDGVTTVLATITLGGPPVFLPPLDVGTHTITVEYSGDDNFNGSISDPLVQEILP